MVIAIPPDTVPHNLTFEEFLEWASAREARDERPKVELVDGEVEFMSPLSVVHQQIGRFLLTLLSLLVETYQPGEVFYESFLMKVGAKGGREPDILYLAEANRHRLRDNYLDGPADLVIEIVSPDGGRRDRIVKRDEYQRRGVEEYWVIDPLKSEAIFYQLQEDGTYRNVAPDEYGIYRSIVIPALWIDVNWLWQNPLPAQTSILRQWGVI